MHQRLVPLRHTCMLPHAAGAPAANTTFFCDGNSTACYFYGGSQVAQTTAQAACRSRGGHLVAYGDHYEQVWG
jgi:hypothetical protein